VERQDAPVAHPAAADGGARPHRGPDLDALPAEATHGTAAMTAKAHGISVRSVQRIWRAHGLQPHRVRQFKLSRDLQFAAELSDFVGLYVDPPAHAVWSVDEKSQIQALDRTQPGLSLKRGRCGTMTHDYKRHGTTTLFAATCCRARSLAAASSVTGIRSSSGFSTPSDARCRPARSSTWLLDNYAAHRHPKVRLAGSASPLRLSLHSDLGLLAQRGRRPFYQAEPTAPQARRLLFGLRSARGHQP
jgi:hypothetical protein